jgi:hypothetical protein
MSQTITFSTDPTPAEAPPAPAPATTPATTPAAPAPAGERPEWLPENFKSAEDLAKSYAELQSELGRLRASQTPPQAETPPTTETQPAPTPDPAAAELAAKGVDFDALATEFMKDGKLSDASYEALEAKGYPKAVVDDYIGMKTAQGNAMAANLKAELGGEAEFDKIARWGSANYTPAQAAAYHEAVESGDFERVSQAVRALKAAYVAARGESPQLISGAASAPSTGGVYRDMSEFLADMSDPRYGVSEAFRKDVQDKLGRSSI